MGANDNVIRVAVMDSTKLLSGVWRIWRHNSDVYVAPRSIAGSFKISLHASGRFRFGFTSDDNAKRFLKEDQDRATFKWPRPSNETQITVLLQIFFPASELVSRFNETKPPKNLVHLTIPKVGDLCVVSIVETIALPPNIVEIAAESYRSRTLSRWSLPDLRQIWVLEHHETPSAEFTKHLEDFKKSLTTKKITKLADQSKSHLKIFVSLHNPDGIVRFVEADGEYIRMSQ